MASLGTGTAHVRCPACDTELPITYTSPDARTLAFDLSSVRTHADTHGTPFTTELPPTAR